MKLWMHLVSAMLLCGLTSLLFGDALIVTRAMKAKTISEIFIEADGIRVELEIGVPGLEAFRNLLPDEIYQRMGFDPEPMKDRVARFFSEDLVFRPEGGPVMTGEILEMAGRRRVPRDEISGRPLPVGGDEEEEPVIIVRLRYTWRNRPETLTITSPRVAAGGVATDIGFVVYHRGLPVTDFRYLGPVETLHLDWDDPWYSRFKNRNLRRQYDAPMAAFLYVEPYEVRKEIVLRPKDLQQWVDLGLEGKDLIPVADQEEIKRKVVEFLSERNPVAIDGQPAEGFVDRIHFIRRTLRMTGVIDPPEDLDVISATLGVIFVYPIDGLPGEATMDWEMFSEQIQRVPAVATDEAGGLPYFLVPDDNVLRWENFLKNPTIPGLVEVQAPPGGAVFWIQLLAWSSLAGFAGLAAAKGGQALRGQWPSRRILTAAAILGIFAAILLPVSRVYSRQSDGEVREIVTGLLENIYRAFDYREESVIYDTLERSATGALLTEIYLETRRSLEIENQGGARAKVNQVEMIDSDHQNLGGERGFTARCTWNVSGSVGHWGHIHKRTNQYQARFTVRAIDGAWKIAEMELLQEERL